MKRRRAEYVDYQERGLEFEVGDLVTLFGSDSEPGRVTQVFPGIGYVDVEFAGANERVPVEDLLRLTPEYGTPDPPYTNSAPVTDMVRTALEAVKLAADQSYLSKKAVLDSLRENPKKVRSLGMRVAMELWAARDPGSMPTLLEHMSDFGSKTASLSCLQRKQQGRKPFVASEWKPEGSAVWTRSLEGQLLSNLRVAVVQCDEDLDGDWVWSIGTKTASGFADSLEDAVEQVDRRLASLGYALR